MGVWISVGEKDTQDKRPSWDSSLFDSRDGYPLARLMRWTGPQG